MNLYQLTAETTCYLKSKYNWYSSSEDINKDFNNVFLPKILKTSTGRNRYPKYYEEALQQVFTAVTILLRDEYTIFGYWYEDEFYTVNKNTKYKTTDDLRKLGITQSVWDSLERGIYYKDNLKFYF